MDVLLVLCVVSTILLLFLFICSIIFPSFLGLLFYYFVYFAIFLVFIIVVGLIIVSFFMKRNVKKLIPCFIILLFMVLFSNSIYDIMHSYFDDQYHLKKGKSFLEKNYNDVTILSVADKDVHLGDSSSNNSCYYTFNVSLRDETGIVFQAGYCDIGTIATSYGEYDNYAYYYVPYYFNKYKEGHNVSFRIDMSENKYDERNIKIYYKSEEDALYFVDYLFKNASGMNYCLSLYEEENRLRDNYCTNNKYNEEKLERDIQRLERRKNREI